MRCAAENCQAPDPASSHVDHAIRVCHSGDISRKVALFVASLSLLAASAGAQTGTIAPVMRHQFFDASGQNPCNACLLYHYASGTTTAQDVFADAGFATAFPQPIVLNSSGRPQISGTEQSLFLTPGLSYRFVLYTSAAVLIWDADNISSIPTTAGNVDVTVTAGEAITEGDVVYLSDGSGSLTAGRVYKADADLSYGSVGAGIVGLATADIASAGTGTIRTAGRVTGLSGLVAGSSYYVSATAGALTVTAPPLTRFLGVADSTTTLLLHADPIDGFPTYLAKTSAYTVTVQDGRDVVIAADASGGAFTVTLYTAVGNTNRRVTVKKTDSSANAVTIDGNASETIDGATTITLTQQYATATLTSNNANWLRTDKAEAIRAASGTAGAPSVAVGDSDVGLFSSATNTLDVTTAGAAALTIDSTQFLDSPTQPRALVYHNTTQDHTSSGNWVALLFNSEDADVGSLHSTSVNTSRLTVPTGGDGVYLVGGTVFLNVVSNTELALRLRKNGGTLVGTQESVRPDVTNSTFGMSTTQIVVLAAADYLELEFKQSSGGTLTTGDASARDEQNQFWIVKLW